MITVFKGCICSLHIVERYYGEDCGQPCECFLFHLFFSILWLLEMIGNEYKAPRGPGFSEGKIKACIQCLWKFLFHSWKVQVGLINSFEDFIFIPEIVSWFYLSKASRWSSRLARSSSLDFSSERFTFKKCLSRVTLEERIGEIYSWYICRLASKNSAWALRLDLETRKQSTYPRWEKQPWTHG